MPKLLRFVFCAAVAVQWCSGCSVVLAAPAPPGNFKVSDLGSSAASADEGHASGKTITVNLVPPTDAVHGRFDVQSLCHHWVANDIFLYTATLKSWNGTAYVAIGSGISTTVNPKATPTAQTKAVFTHLDRGTKYQVGIVATGNNGGTAGTSTLNAATPTQAIYDFTAAQDVQDTLTSSLTVALDPVPFSGTLTINPTNVPVGTVNYTIAFKDMDSVTTLFSSTYPVNQVETITNVKPGVHYQVTLAANSSCCVIGSASSAINYFDPTLQNIDQAQTAVVAF